MCDDESVVEKGGGYGVALDDDGLRDGLDGSSSSRRWLNGDCEDHLVYVYCDAHMVSTALGGEGVDDWDFLGWPATTDDCVSSTDGVVSTWIGVRWGCQVCGTGRRRASRTIVPEQWQDGPA